MVLDKSWLVLMPLERYACRATNSNTHQTETVPEMKLRIYAVVKVTRAKISEIKKESVQEFR